MNAPTEPGVYHCCCIFSKQRKFVLVERNKKGKPIVREFGSKSAFAIRWYTDWSARIEEEPATERGEEKR